MALTQCKECGHEISKKAEKCPQCGVPQKKKTSAFTWLLLILIIFGVYGYIKNPSNTGSQSVTTESSTAPAGSQSVTAESSTVPAFDTSPEKQAERKQFIEKLIKMGVLYKVEVPAELPHVYVAPSFYALNVDDKQRFINVVYAYYLAQSPRANIVTLYDSKSGKKIGMFTERGLDLD